MRSPPARKFAPILLVICLFAPPAEGGERGDWDIRIGAGARYAPKYEGSDEMKTRALPLIDIRWKDRVFLNPRDGLGVRVYDEGGLTVSAGVGYAFGRDESDGDALRGMGDIDETAAANLILKYDLGLVTPYAGVSRHLGGSGGTLVKAGVGAVAPLRPAERKNETARDGRWRTERPGAPARRVRHLGRRRLHGKLLRRESGAVFGLGPPAVHAEAGTEIGGLRSRRDLSVCGKLGGECAGRVLAIAGRRRRQSHRQRRRPVFRRVVSVLRFLIPQRCFSNRSAAVSSRRAGSMCGGVEKAASLVIPPP